MKYIIIHKTKAVTTNHDFDLTDKRKRRIGATVTRWQEAFDAGSDDQAGDWHTDRNIKIGQPYHCIRVQATRDGISYGACQSTLRFETKEEADAYVAKYLKSAKSRAMKNIIAHG